MYICLKFVVFRTDFDETLSEFHEMLMIYKLSDTNVLRTVLHSIFKQIGIGLC